jgi:hypothetical protein
MVFFVIPTFFLLLPALSSIFTMEYSFYLLYSLIWYFPYVLYSIATYWIAENYKKSRSQEKEDKAHLIFWGNNILGISILSVLMQIMLFFSIIEGFNFRMAEILKTGTGLVIINSVMFLLSIFFRKSILIDRIY